MPLPLIAAGAAVIRILPAAATILRGGVSLVGGLLRKSPTYGGMLAFGAAATGAPYALKLAEHESGGMVSEKVVDASIGYIKDKIKEGLSPKEIEEKIDSLDYIVQVNGAFKKSAQNLYVREIMQSNEGPDAIKKGKMAAVSFQLLPEGMAMLYAKYLVKSSVVDDMFKGDKNAADRYLANSLINDIVANAQVRALDGNQVTRDDVRKTLTDIINNPDKHPVASKFFQDRGRLMNGLKQEWPELDSGSSEFQRQQQSRVNAGSAPDGPRSRMAESFKRAVEDDNDPSIFKVLSIFLTLLLNLFGGHSLANQFRGASHGHDAGVPQLPSAKATPTDNLQGSQPRRNGLTPGIT